MQIIVTKSSRANITLNTYFIKRSDVISLRRRFKSHPRKKTRRVENSKVCRFSVRKMFSSSKFSGQSIQLFKLLDERYYQCFAY